MASYGSCCESSGYITNGRWLLSKASVEVGQYEEGKRIRVAGCCELDSHPGLEEIPLARAW